MRQKQPLLIATTNRGKFADFVHVLGDLPFDIVSLADVGYNAPGPEENETTLFGNAVLKARYYGERFNQVALADDSGLFIDALDGWPGIESARIAADNDARNALVLERLHGMPEDRRGAEFRVCIAAYDPRTHNVFTAVGAIRGRILQERVAADNGFGYDPIFFVPDAGKTFAEMSHAEKNAMSHRGKALSHMKYILQNEYGGKHIVVPVALILKNNSVLLSKRNDPFRPEFHGKWEFPGGRMDIGESLEENLVREVQEEVGLIVRPLQRLSAIWVEYQSGPQWAYQVYLIPFVCSVVEEGGVLSDAEVMETRWCGLDEVLEMELIGANKEMYKAILPEIKTL